MRRRLAIAAVIAFVAVDAVLIVLALHHTNHGSTTGASQPVASLTAQPPQASTSWNADQSRTNTRSTGDVLQSDQPSRTQSYVPSSDRNQESSSQTATNSAAVSTTESPVDHPTDSPTDSTDTTDSTQSTGTQTPPAPVPPAQRVLLDMSSDGSVIRAVRGDCATGTGTTVQVSTDGGKTFHEAPTQPDQVLRVAARRAGAVFYVDADSSCKASEQDSSDGGATWTQSAPSGSWYLQPDARSTSIDGPDGASDTGCTPLALAVRSSSSAVVVCTDGMLRATDNTGATWHDLTQLPGALSVTFPDATHGYVLAAQPTCPAAVLTTSDSGATWRRAACLQAHDPQAIAAAGDAVLVQAAGTLRRSTNGGVTWAPVP